MKKTLLKIFCASALASAMVLGAGCEHSGHNGDSGDSSIVGTWSLTNSGSTWYIHFADDGTWKITDDEAGSARRVYGTYTADSKSFDGTMKNPGVGDGEINGTYTDTEISLDFIEHWHTPYKHVPYTGTKL